MFFVLHEYKEDSKERNRFSMRLQNNRQYGNLCLVLDSQNFFHSCFRNKIALMVCHCGISGVSVRVCMCV